MQKFEKKFKEFINEEKEGSFYDDGSFLERLIEYSDEISDYVAVDELNRDFASFAANELGEPGAEEENPEYFTLETINKRIPKIVDKFFKTRNAGQNWLWLAAKNLLEHDFFDGPKGSLIFHDYDEIRADNKWRNWYEDYEKPLSLSDADEAAELFASWLGKDTDTDDYSEELEAANEMSYPLKVSRGYGIQAYGEDGEYPSIQANPSALEVEDDKEGYMYSDSDEKYSATVEKFNPREDMFDQFRDARGALLSFLNKFGY